MLIVCSMWWWMQLAVDKRLIANYCTPDEAISGKCSPIGVISSSLMW
jgi:hypothetical protein